jgi:hypothetical protein
MKKLLLILWALAVATPLYADCPVKHPALTALDHDAMLAAYTASFRGIYGRNPTGVVGSGLDDANYWISVSDHYGEFGDTICRAGWSAYWEMKLTGQDAVDPKLGDQPARFQPGASPQPPVIVPPVVVPPVTPPLDLSAVQAQLDAIAAELHGLVLTDANEHSQILTETRGISAWLGDHWKSITMIAGPFVTYATCRVTGKC